MPLGWTGQTFDALLQYSREADKNNQNPMARHARIVTRTHREWLLLNAERCVMREKWADYFRKYDVLLCPAVRIAAFPHDHTEFLERTTRFNDQYLSHRDVLLPWASLATVAYLPATVVPVGLTSSGLPVGAQVVGPYLEDRTSIHFARLLEEAFGGFSPPPGFE